MGKSGVSLDTVMINIESDAGRSTSNIDSLSASLTKLKNSISGGFASLNNLATYLTNLNNSTQGLDKSLSALSSIENITHTLSQLNSLDTPKGFTSAVNSLKTLNKESSNLKNASDSLLSISDIIPHLGGLATIKAPSGLTSTVRNLGELSKLSGVDNMIEQMKKIPQLVEPLSSLKDIESPRGLQNVVDNLAKLPEVINKFDTTAFENLKRVSEELAQSLTPLADKMMQVANGYSAFSKIQNTFGKSASTSYRYMKQQKSILSSLGSIVKNVGSKFLQTGRNVQSAFGRSAINDLKKFHSKFKQVFLSLLGTRTLFTMIRKAVSEYEAFDTTLQKFSQNVWRAFGAQLAPVIEYVMNLFKQFVRVIYSVVYALTGIDLIAKANEKAMASWGSSAKDTLGTLQKFDDLNVVEFDTSKGAGNDNELIDMDKIDLTPIQKIIDWVNEMKDAINEALDTGKWYNVGKVFAEGIGEGIDWLLSKIPEIREKLFEVARSFGDFLNGVIENTNWSGIGKLITESLILIPDTITELLKTIHWDELGKGINEALKAFDPVKIVNSIMGMLGTLATGLAEAFINIEWGPVGKKIGDSIVAFFTDLSSILDKIPWNQIGQRVKEAIEGVPWKKVWDSIVKLADTSFENIKSFFEGLTGLSSKEIGAIADSIVQMGEAFVTYKLVDKVVDFTKAFSVGADSINPWVLLVSGIVLVITEVKKAFDAIDKGDYKKAEDIANGLKLFSLAILAIGAVIGIIAVLNEKFGKTGKAMKDVGEKTKEGSKGFSNLFGDLGKAAEIIAILGGLSLVIESITKLIKAFGDTGVSASDGIMLIATAFGAIAIAFASIAAASKLLDLKSTIEIVAVLASLAIVLESVTRLFNAFSNTNLSVGDGLLFLGGVLGIVLIAMGAMAAIAKVLGSDPLVLIAVLALTAAISAVLLVLEKTLPKILDSCGKFIKAVAPYIIELVTIIADLIKDVIKSLGTVLPPIINSVGNLFTKIFNGISKVIKTVGDSIVKIMNTAGNLVDKVLKSILNFINQLGPAINNFVDNAIKAVTKLINFIVSAIEYLINTAIVKPINALIKTINDNAIAEKLGWQIGKLSKVSIDRFAPKLETGTNKIPNEGLYHLHPGEAVVPKKYNPALGNGGSDEMNNKLDTLIDIMNNMSFTNVVNLGNEKLYEKQQSFNKKQQNKYGTINLY